MDTDAARILGLDHVVIAVDALDAAIADYRALGFTVTPGGRHPGRTSHNALVVFDDGAYLELIAWTAPAPEERWWRTLQAAGAGYVDHALLPQDTVAALQAARARGLDTLVGPVDGGRVRPDGAQLRWQTARHATPDLPFLCGDLTPRALRVPEGAARLHANGACGVAGVDVAVQALDATLARYRALLGPDLAVTRDSSEGIDAASFGVGVCRLRLLSPGATASAAGQALAQHLQTRGEGPLRLWLHAKPQSTPQAARTPLPATATHGAAMAWA